MREASVIKAAVIFNKERHAYHNGKKVTKEQHDTNKTTERERGCFQCVTTPAARVRL